MGSIAQSIPIVGSKGKGDYPEPLKQTGVLERFEYEDVTPVIGREFPSANIVDDFLNSLDGDALLRDLAITSESRLLILQLHYIRANPNPQSVNEASSSSGSRTI